MATLLVVEDLDVVEHSLLCSGVRGESLAALCLEGGVPCLHRRAVEDVALVAHATGDAVRGEDLLLVLARVRAALVRVVEQAGTRTAPADSHAERAHGDEAVVRGREAQTTTYFENRPRMTARKSLPFPVPSSVVSPTQRWFGHAAVTPLLRRLSGGAGG